ncbi:LrgB family protein [Gorillibacterium sp. CAU 1737]|uniref:LrgB family protein n=1 Tax=Gorillibacterium sp. CAU 1737 TaxID=3140362 RepID=UPI003261644D
MIWVMGIFYVLLTLGAYLISKLLYRKTKFLLFTPFLIAPLAIAALLMSTGVEYDTYNHGAKVITKLLQPATVAFAIPLYRYSGLLWKHRKAMLIGIGSGILLSLGTTLLLTAIAQMDAGTVRSLLPHSVTTPLAMLLSETLKGDPQVSVLFTIMTGIAGMVLGPIVIRLFRIKHEVSKGLLLGVGAHAAGTAKAFELGEQEGAIASVVTIVTALLTLLVAPALVSLLGIA